MAASRHDMRDVELVEDDGAHGAALHDGDPARSGRDTGPAHHRPPAHPRRRSTAAVGLLTLVGLALGDAVADADARAGLALLAGVPGVVAPLDRPQVELWRADPTLR